MDSAHSNTLSGHDAVIFSGGGLHVVDKSDEVQQWPVVDKKDQQKINVVLINIFSTTKRIHCMLAKVHRTILHVIRFYICTTESIVQYI